MPKRYLVALGVAVIIVATAAIFVGQTRKAIVAQIRRSLQEAKAAGTLPAELQNENLDTASLQDFGMELAPGMRIRVTIADVIASLWFVWIPLLLVTCLGVASLFRRNSGDSQSHG